ncbi:MAG: site-specific integrase [Bacillus sp. (in: Bacteria)]|nr:site-specific integrase [Bacillus sp. (in: firmicutes)]
MKGHFYKPNCKCENGKKCKCGAKWGFLIDVGINPKTGRRKQKFKGGFNTKKEVERAAAQFLAELEAGQYIKEVNITFEDFAYQWLEMYEATGKVKTSTIRIRKHEIMRLLDYFAKLKLKDVSRKIYQDALNDLKTLGFADNTLDGAHRTGRMIFKKALEIELLKKDPTEYAYVPKTQKSVEDLESEEYVIKYLEKEDLAKFLKTANVHGLDQDYVIFILLAYTGIRVGELCALKWQDIDFVHQSINITKTYYNPVNNITKYQLLTPKTKSSKRTVEIDTFVVKELEKHQLFQKRVKMRYQNRYHDKDFVFALIDEKNPGYPLYIKKIENRMTRLLKLANNGLGTEDNKINEELTPHSLRHTHTSLLAEAGVGLQEIMDRLGHKDDATTKNVYWHVTKPKKKEAAHKFSELMKDLR